MIFGNYLLMFLKVWVDNSLIVLWPYKPFD
jgi:hypothetical protein